KISRESPKASHNSSNAAHARLNRRNHAKQTQAKKRIEILPRTVAVVPLCPDISSRNIVASIVRSLEVSAEDCTEDGIWRMKADRFKTSLQFRTLPYRSFYPTLDACKAADYVIFALSSTVEVEEWADTLLRALQSQGLPEVVTRWIPKLKTGVLKSLLSFIQYFVPSQARVFDLHTPSDQLNVLRSVSEGSPSDVRWRDGRSWVLSEQTQWEEGTLKVTGVLRGSPFSANQLVHIPNYGDFQVSQVRLVSTSSPKVEGMPPWTLNLFSSPEPNADDADSLVSSNEPDDLDNEQTWPTEEEMNGALGSNQDISIPEANPGTTPKAVKKIPKGMNEYMASTENDSDHSYDEMQEEEMQEAAEAAVEDPTEIESERHVTFQDLDEEEEAEQLEEWRNRKREEEDDAAFPDEIDTPQDITAHQRFARYRGMRSFRTSPWDPYENLPREYARIFQFEDFKRTERKVRRKAEQAPNAVQAGTREVAKVNALGVFSLFQHEHKVTTLNFTVQRNTEYDESVRSKDPLILCIGPRRFAVDPQYSQHTRGGGKGTNNVHKYERYLRHGVTSVATIYGPVTYGHQSCTLLRETKDPQAPHLVAYGSSLNTDTTRIIAKRIILSGHPFKVHKKTATIRYMFFNADDIQYFKPIQLHTKYGRVGHIKESLGTHGYFKAYFDGPINQMDTVCMSLYKRVYPRWYNLAQIAKIQDRDDDAMEE
ncbi:DUF663-domain-containing protein, partial [Coprinellus micaceus]